MAGAQVSSYDLLDTYPGGPYKSRGGSIKRTRFVEEEEEDDDEDDGAVRAPCSMHFMRACRAGLPVLGGLGGTAAPWRCRCHAAGSCRRCDADVSADLSARVHGGRAGVHGGALQRGGGPAGGDRAGRRRQGGGRGRACSGVHD